MDLVFVAVCKGCNITGGYLSPKSNQSIFLIKTSISHLPWTGVTCGNDNFMKIDLKATARMSDYSNLRVVEASSRTREVVDHANKLAGIIK